ncbi:MAG: hypothetical protein ABIM89_11685 [Mycobacteriales bacterium]
MNAVTTKTLTRQQPRGWDDATDGAFFRIVSSLFPPEFLFGAGVLLALNDADVDSDLDLDRAPSDG